MPEVAVVDMLGLAGSKPARWRADVVKLRLEAARGDCLDAWMIEACGDVKLTPSTSELAATSCTGWRGLEVSVKIDDGAGKELASCAYVSEAVWSWLAK